MRSSRTYRPDPINKAIDNCEAEMMTRIKKLEEEKLMKLQTQGGEVRELRKRIDATIESSTTVRDKVMLEFLDQYGEEEPSFSDSLCPISVHSKYLSNNTSLTPRKAKSMQSYTSNLRSPSIPNSTKPHPSLKPIRRLRWRLNSCSSSTRIKYASCWQNTWM